MPSLQVCGLELCSPIEKLPMGQGAHVSCFKNQNRVKHHERGEGIVMYSKLPKERLRQEPTFAVFEKAVGGAATLAATLGAKGSRVGLMVAGNRYGSATSALDSARKLTARLAAFLFRRFCCSGRPGGACGGPWGEAISVHAQHRTQEEDVVANWLYTETAPEHVTVEAANAACSGLYRGTIFNKWGLLHESKGTQTRQGVDYVNTTDAEDYGDAWTVKNCWVSGIGDSQQPDAACSSFHLHCRRDVHMC